MKTKDPKIGKYGSPFPMHGIEKDLMDDVDYSRYYMRQSDARIIELVYKVAEKLTDECGYSVDVNVSVPTVLMILVGKDMLITVHAEKKEESIKIRFIKDSCASDKIKVDKSISADAFVDHFKEFVCGQTPCLEHESTDEQTYQ